jgi:hypothetical protein
MRIGSYRQETRGFKEGNLETEVIFNLFSAYEAWKAPLA